MPPIQSPLDRQISALYPKLMDTITATAINKRSNILGLNDLSDHICWTIDVPPAVARWIVDELSGPVNNQP